MLKLINEILSELQFRKKPTLFVLALMFNIGVLFSSCAFSSFRDNGEVKRISVGSWNVQAFFDGVTTGGEYDEYKEKAGWSPEKYSARKTALIQAITGLSDPNKPDSQKKKLKGPDVLAFIEVENATVLNEVAEESIADCGYVNTFFAVNPGYSLGVGVISRFPFTQTRTHSLANSGEITPRPIVEVWIEPEGKPLVILVCHWKSKLGGEKQTEPRRMDGASVVLRRIREIQHETPQVPIIVLGDFNENHDEFYRRGSDALCAFLPDDIVAAELAGFSGSLDDGGGCGDEIQKKQKNYLVLSNQKPPKSDFFPSGTIVLYTPWGSELENGSYYYKQNWETIDNMLLSGGFFDNADWDFESVAVIDAAPFVNGKGTPYTYNPRTGTGLSDHLPMFLTLSLKNGETG
jgi:endonuclease/exonuclease/phosphatase family metal-dependent hydrolase